MIRVLIVDDHEIVRKSILKLLNREPDIDVVGTAVNGEDAIESTQKLTPDVVVMDVSMPVLDGIRAAGKISDLDLPSKILMLSMHFSSALVQQARKNGAIGYIIKQEASSELIPAIRAAYAGELQL